MREPTYSATLGRGQRGGVEDTYIPPIPEACPPEFSKTIRDMFRPEGYPEDPAVSVRIAHESPARFGIVARAGTDSVPRQTSSGQRTAGPFVSDRVRNPAPTTSANLAAIQSTFASMSARAQTGSFPAAGSGTSLSSEMLSPLRSAASSRTYLLHEEDHRASS